LNDDIISKEDPNLSCEKLWKINFFKYFETNGCGHFLGDDYELITQFDYSFLSE
jgi:hypothetical protein